ncbi:MAG: ABC transporter ATP-binding protein, partial [Treponema sp.]|nr:ABC transporter ATP-binding protein [Treponema sp.]
KLMLSGANIITMDDPTNHLDLEAIQSLNEGLISFPGVLLFSSHDHEFIQSIANRIIEITPNGVIDRMMSFDDYISDDTITEQRKKLYEGTGKKIKYRV